MVQVFRCDIGFSVSIRTLNAYCNDSKSEFLVRMIELGFCVELARFLFDTPMLLKSCDFDMR